MKIRFYDTASKFWMSRKLNGGLFCEQMEIPYQEFDFETGVLVGAGSEDFSPERYSYEIKDRWCYTWDGSKRDRGGHRRFDDHGIYRYRKSQSRVVKEFLQKKYNAALVEMRPW